MSGRRLESSRCRHVGYSTVNLPLVNKSASADVSIPYEWIREERFNVVNVQLSECQVSAMVNGYKYGHPALKSNIAGRDASR